MAHYQLHRPWLRVSQRRPRLLPHPPRRNPLPRRRLLLALLRPIQLKEPLRRAEVRARCG